MHVAIVTTFPPGKGTLNEYAYHFVRALRYKSEVTQVTLLVDELPAGDVYPAMGHRSQNNYPCAGGSFRQSQRPASMVRCSAASRAAQVGKQPPTLDSACAPDGFAG